VPAAVPSAPIGPDKPSSAVWQPVTPRGYAAWPLGAGKDRRVGQPAYARCRGCWLRAARRAGARRATGKPRVPEPPSPPVASAVSFAIGPARRPLRAMSSPRPRGTAAERAGHRRCVVLDGATQLLLPFASRAAAPGGAVHRESTSDGSPQPELVCVRAHRIGSRHGAND